MQAEKGNLDRELVEHLRDVDLKKGDIILKVGEKASGFYLIDASCIGQFNNGNKVKLQSDEYIAIGLKELILDIKASYHIEVEKNCSAKFLPAKEFSTLFETTESFPRTISRILSSNTDVGLVFDENKRVERLEKLVEASRIVNSTLDLNELLKIILDTALESVNGDRGTVYLLNEQKNELWSKVFEGGKSVTIHLPVGEGIAGKVAETGEVMNIDDAQTDDRFNPEVDKKTGYTTETILCMPLKNKDGKMLGVFQLLNKIDGTFTKDDEQFIETLSIHVASALENARLYEQEQKKIEMEKEMLAAGEVQKNLFPAEIPQYNNYHISAINIPARETSGDLYDFVQLDETRLVFTLGDVSGKGLPASILMANLQSVLKDLPHQNSSPAFCVSRANDIINRASSSGKFITLFLGLLDTNKHKLMYTNAGHEHPYLFRNGETERLGTGGIPVGIIPGSDFEEEEYTIQRGDLLLVFSDGVMDATNADDEYYSEERLADFVLKNRDLTPKEIVDKVCDDIKEFVGDAPQFDDITLMVIKRMN